MVSFDLKKTELEVLNFLRYKLNTYDPKSRITETTTPFTATASQEYFTLSATTMSYVKSVTINAALQTYGTDYEIVWDGANMGKVKLTTPATLNDSVSIVWGSIAATKSNFVQPEYPRADLGKSSYPRVGFIIMDTEKPAGLGGGLDMPFVHNTTISIKLIDEMGQLFIDNVANELKSIIKKNCKNFTNFRFISPNNTGQYTITEDESNNIISKIIDFEIPDAFETITYE